MARVLIDVLFTMMSYFAPRIATPRRPQLFAMSSPGMTRPGSVRSGRPLVWLQRSHRPASRCHSSFFLTIRLALDSCR